MKLLLGNRMKGYEEVSRYQLMKRAPVIVRVDGKAFHTFTKKCNKPFDDRIINCMVNAAKAVAEEMQGFKAGYVQSDEATFVLTDYDDVHTQGWLGYKLNKMVSVSAALMTAYFNVFWRAAAGMGYDGRLALFDSRAFNVPREEVVNNLLWRANDWERNSLQMYCRSIFSHKQLMNKNRQDMHEMLHDKSKNWSTDLTNQEKNGTFLIKRVGGEALEPFMRGIEERHDILPTYESIGDTLRLDKYESKKIF
jgi:tRNA(His) guanylyltransferase